MLTDKLIEEGRLDKDEYKELLDTCTEQDMDRLKEAAVSVRRRHYGTKVYVRGLIEYTNYCRNNCYYCGIRADNRRVSRYRLTDEEILECCRAGYRLGLRTFVLQGGEDARDTDGRMETLIRGIKDEFPDCAVTLSIGERSPESYRRLRQAGVDRYLLRHETADEGHYRILHPEPLSLSHRKECLYQLKRLGYQVGAGFMVGSPGQDNACLASDLVFLEELKPQMVGIGPFVPHHDTPFAGKEKGSVEKTLLMLSIVRILLPKALIPATTALGTVDTEGREKGLQAGANVVMPNLSPVGVRKRYALYDGKICTGEEAVESLKRLEVSIGNAGYQLVYDRGDAAV